MRVPTQPQCPPLSHLFQTINLAFVFTLLMQSVPCVGYELDVTMLNRMRCQEEERTQLLQEVEQSSMGTQALLFTAFQICIAVCVSVLNS